jgi:hypothetical protein
MLRRDSNYQRLKVGGRDIAGRASYWLAADHLLVVREEGFQERYRRFYLRDVQALIISRNVMGLLTTLVLTALGGLMAIAALATQNPAGRWVWAFIAACFVIALIAHLVGGPTADCHLRTAVQLERLPGVTRLRVAQRLIAAMTPAIQTAQRDIEAQASVPPTFEEAADFPLASPTKAPPASPPQPLRHYHGRMHAIAFSLMLVDAAVGLFYLVTELSIFENINIGVTVAELGFVIAALVKQHRTDMSVVVRRIGWGVVIFYGVSLVFGIVMGIYLVATGGVDLDLEELKPSSHPAMFTFYLVSSAFLLGAGLLGWRALVKFRREYVPPAPPPLPPVPPTSPPARVDVVEPPKADVTPPPPAPPVA